MSESGEVPILRIGVNDCSGSKLRTKVFSGGQVARTDGAVLQSSCERSPAQLGPSVGQFVLKVKGGGTDNIWRDEDFRPVVTEDDEFYIIDNA